MKLQIALCTLVAAAFLPACTTTTQTTSNDYKTSRYANNAVGEEPAPPAEGPAEDIPSEGPADIQANPAYVPTPLLRRSAATGP